MSNRLAQEQSPYLLQHKDNPVDWYPWSEEAFEKAHREDKPIFLSIGYSTCHWCHVMERESFEDEEVAALMNDAFVSIKVDREERPDIDGVYMTACQMMTGQGGWPLTVIMTPDKQPFHVATYVPKSSRFGRMGMLDLVPRIKDVWENRRSDVIETANKVTSSLQRATGTAGDGVADGEEELLRQAFESLSERFDAEHGGFGSAPKFPSPHNLFFLLRYWRRTGSQPAMEMVTSTLRRMRLGGMFDHVGFGFHRYSTDREWLLPHFEKMLYDQALLAIAYTEAYQATSDADFERTAREIFEYVLRDLRSPEGAFYSAQDADSEGREGKFYVWSIEEIRSVLPDDLAELVIRTFNIAPNGNFVEETSRERTGENILHLSEPVEPVGEVERARKLLFEAREKRVRPGLDDKVLLDWNGLMIAALAKAAAAFDDPEFADAAESAGRFLLNEMRRDGQMLHRFRNGESGVQAVLDDYAFLTWGMIELYEATFDAGYLREALRLQDEQVKQFWDEEGGGFFFTASDAESLLVRQKEFYDAAIPSGNAVSLWNLLRLARMTGRTEFEERADRLVAAAAGLSRMPEGFTALLCGLDFAIGPTAEIVLAGRRDAEDVQRLLRTVRSGFRPRKVVLFHAAEDDALPELAPFVEAQKPIDNQAAAYVCRDFICERPITEADELRNVLND